MKVKDKRMILSLLDEKKYDEIRAYVESQPKDHMRSSMTARERNTKWAFGNADIINILNMHVGESVIVRDHPRGTVSCVATYAYPDRKYRYVTLKDGTGAFLVARIR